LATGVADAILLREADAKREAKNNDTLFIFATTHSV